MKFVFISSLSTPMMNKFCEELNYHCNAHFLFYEEAVTRPDWWRNFPKAKNSEILEGTRKLANGKYWNRSLVNRLECIDPDIVVLGGFFIPSNWVAYRWAKKNNKKVVVFSEKLGYSADPKSRRKLTYSKIFKVLTRFLYSKIDLLMAVSSVGYNNFINDFGFSSSIVQRVQYPVDMEQHLRMSPRSHDKPLTLLFPHRLIDTYNPLKAIEWFHAIASTVPDANLHMNGFGSLRVEVENKIKALNLAGRVHFMDAITSWDQLPKVYSDADVILSTKSAIPGDSDWSIAEMESAAAGLGFIINNSSIGLVEYLREHSSGFVTDGLDDIDFVVKAAKSYNDDRQLLCRHGESNQKNIRVYSIPNAAQNFIKALKHIR